MDHRRCAGPTAAVIEERRPVELEQPLLRRRPSSRRSCTCCPTLVDGRPNPRGRAARRRGAAAPRRAAARPAAPPLLHARAGSRWSSGSQDEDMLPGDLLHLQPGRRATTRPRRLPRRRAAADHAGRARPDPGDRRRAHRGARRRRPRRARLRPLARRARGGRRRPPRRDGAAVQGGGRGLLRRGAGEGACSPPRRWPSASTCRPARW